MRPADDFKRISQVVHVLFKHGLGFVIEELHLGFHLPFSKKLQRHRFRQPPSPEVRLRKVLEELGGTYVKLGQLLSIRPDLIHMDYCRELQKLQDNVPPFSIAEARKVIKRELKGWPFKDFNEKPIASASIGQVYGARLKNGQRVAVKVQRPGISEKIEADMHIISYFARKMEKHHFFRKFRPTLIVEEFRRYTRNELSYVQEAANAERFARNFRGSRSIKIPKVYMTYTTRSVLTLEYIDGVKFNELVRSRTPVNRRFLIETGMSAEMKQVFEDGFFHADLHPGNVLLLKNRKIAFLDFGIVGSLTPRLQTHAVMLFLAVMQEDTVAVADILMRIGKTGPDTDKEEFSREVDSIVRSWYGASLKQERVTYMLHRLFNLCAVHDVRLPLDLVLLGKALVTIEGTCELIEPDFDVIKHSQPYFKKLLKKQSAMQLKRLVAKYSNLKQALLDLPDKTAAVAEALKHPKIKIDVEDTDIRTLSSEMGRSSRRLSNGLLLSALVVAGALMMQVNTGPRLFGLPIFALLLFSAAAIIAVLFIFTPFKEQR
jgi:ubiquinone biosynthesis protein